MELSIVIPCLNSEKTIVKTIDSIDDQLTFYNIQIIFSIDEHTTDNTIKVIRERMKKSLIPFIIVSSEGGNCAIVDNDGANAATGEYIWFIDSDDWLVDNRFIIEKSMTLCTVHKLSALEFGFESEFPNKNTMTTWRHIYAAKYVHELPFSSMKVGSDSYFNLLLRTNEEFKKNMMVIKDVFYHYSWPNPNSAVGGNVL